MKKLSLLCLLILLSSCKRKDKKLISEFTEQDAYEIINVHLVVQLSKYQPDYIIYLNSRQLKSHKSNDSINFKQMPPAPYPVFASEYWKIRNVNGVRVVEWKEYNSFFQKNDSIDLEQLWDTKFNGGYVHNISYPIYNPKTKIAVFKDYIYRPFLICGTDLSNFYYYKKTDSGWVVLK